MKRYQEIQVNEKVVPAHVDKKELDPECDICHRVYHERRGYSNNSYNRCEVTISKEEGQVYPDSGSTTTYSFDVCPDCFNNHIVPFMEQFGAKMNEHESDW